MTKVSETTDTTADASKAPVKKPVSYQFWKLQSQLTKDKIKLTKLQEKIEKLEHKLCESEAEK